MKYSALGRWTTVKIASTVLLLFSFPTNAQVCSGAKPATINAATDVYEYPPTFSTGSGYARSKIITTLQPHTSVFVCADRSVGVVFDKQTWVQIEFDDGKTGWVYAAAVSIAGVNIPDDKKALDVLSVFITTAHAESTQAAPMAPPKASPAPSLWPIYILMFFAVCIGMAAKALFDWLQQNGAIDQNYKRETLKAWLVSPIVFTGVLQAGDFSLETATKFALLLCWAFQNGFFWQTVLVKSAPK